MNTPQLGGTWELREAQNGMMPLKEYAAGNGNRLWFSDAAYERRTDGSVSAKGSYQLVKDSSASASVGLELPDGKYEHRLIFDGDTTADKTFIHVSGDTLEMLQGFFPVDAGSKLVYVKAGNDR